MLILTYTKFILNCPMANLTEISVGVRKLGKFILIAIGSILVFRFLIFAGIAIYKATHIPPPAPPDVAFGKLPKPKFPDNLVTSANLTFSLENIEGKPPETTASARVFTMPKKSYTFESGENAKETAKKLNFEDDPHVDTVFYYFARKDNPKLTLFVDGTSLNFHYKYNYAEDSNIFQTDQISSIEDAQKNSKDFLTFSNLWDSSVLDGDIKSEVLVYDGRIQKLVEATSLSTAQAVRVNFFRKEIDELMLVQDEFTTSHNFVLYAATPGTELNNILEISYIFWPIDMNSYASYPLLTSEEAFQALTRGEARIVTKGNNSENIKIRKIYLGYFDSAIPQAYLQPIFIFEGDNGFIAYLPALKADYLN